MFTCSPAHLLSCSPAHAIWLGGRGGAGAKAYTNAEEGRRYVRYSYAATRCVVGEYDDGECYGSLATRRSLATVTMSSLSQYRTNTERERMKELGQVCPHE